MRKGKLFIIALIAIGGLIGVTLSYGTAYALHETSDHKFCVVCHEMDPMVMAYKDDVHGGAGPTGASAKCVDCHLPHDSLAKYVFQKAKNGMVEGYIHFFGDEVDWHKNRQKRENYVFDSGCLECHGNILKTDYVTSKPIAKKMHEHYEKLLNTEKQVACVSCHFDAGHKNMRNYLNYYKPEYSIYGEKMHEKKIEAIEKHKHHTGINTDAGEHTPIHSEESTEKTEETAN